MCVRVKMEGGAVVICGGYKTKFCFCGRVAVHLCDWKVPSRESGTCDQPLCMSHSHEVGRNKHLCTQHRTAWELWQRRHRVVNIMDYRTKIAGQGVLFPEQPA